MQRAQEPLGDVALGPVGLDLGQVHEESKIALARGEPEIGAAMAGELGRVRERRRGVAQHLCRPPLPVAVVIPAVEAGDALVARGGSRAEREVDLIAVTTRWRLGAGELVIRREKEFSLRL